MEWNYPSTPRRKPGGAPLGVPAGLIHCCRSLLLLLLPLQQPRRGLLLSFCHWRRLFKWPHASRRRPNDEDIQMQAWRACA